MQELLVGLDDGCLLEGIPCQDSWSWARRPSLVGDAGVLPTLQPFLDHEIGVVGDFEPALRSLSPRDELLLGHLVLPLGPDAVAITVEVRVATRIVHWSVLLPPNSGVLIIRPGRVPALLLL